ncbi:DUF4364 family protein [Cellulosilyticum sp. I15G10I2]|uniref:DUF4364 family protein n=1 Tax=Cellulosilyticum sp. I15G10I2 TaxID=1892843 RepID=UPI00085C9985|nr:DUF4364 family protein [Cellulosilyticum sp. I15G10I2]
MINNHEDFTINKLIILYLLSQVKIPLSLSQMTQIILERGYTNYFSLQQYLNELEKSYFIMTSKQNNTSYFEITDKGVETLDFFSSRIPDFIRKELDLFIEANWRKLRSELDIHAEYTPNKSNEYIVNCKVTENNSSLIELSVSVGSKKQAIELCNKWKTSASTLYSEILQLLSK